MTGEMTRVRAGSMIPRVKSALLFTFALGVISGCNIPRESVDRSYLETVPDKESYLLDKLSVCYENPDVLCELGRYYQSVGKWDKARFYFDTSLGFDPSHRETQAAYINMLVASNNRVQADKTLAHFQQQLQTAPFEMLKLADALAKENLDDYALSCYQQTLQIAPHSFEANKQIGLFYLERQNNELASTYLKKSFDQNPNQPDVALALGRLGYTVEVPVKYQAMTGDKDSGSDT